VVASGRSERADVLGFPGFKSKKPHAPETHAAFFRPDDHTTFIASALSR
jgi:hypothetical protein